MAKATKPEVVTLPSVEECVEFVKNAVPNVEQLQETKREHIAKADAHKNARILASTFESAGIDPIPALEYAIANESDSAKRETAETKLNAIRDYAEWNLEGERIESELQGAYGKIREVVSALNAITGDKTVHKTYKKGGNKTGANGERINHGYMLKITDVKTQSVVPHPVTNDEVWKSANEAVRALVPDSLSPKLDETGEQVINKKGEPVFYNMNADACTRTLRKAGYKVEFVA